MPVFNATAATSGVWTRWAVTASSTNVTTASSLVWDAWMSSVNTTSLPPTGTASVWNTWAATTTNVTTLPVWYRWVSGGGQSIGGVPAHAVPEDAEEQRRAREALAAAARERQAAAEATAQAAKSRAKRLLLSVLDEEQRRELLANDRFYVRSQLGNLYRIDAGWSGNVKRVDPETREWVESLCCHPVERVPVYDNMLIQKLMLETAEETFREYANITARRGDFVGARRGQLTGEILDNVVFLADRQRQAA